MSGFDNFGWERLCDHMKSERSRKDIILQTVESQKRMIGTSAFNSIVEAVKEGWIDYVEDDDEDDDE